MSLRLVIDARTATTHFPGIGRYAFNLARAMGPALSPEESLILLRDPTQPSALDLTTLAGDQVRIVDVPLTPFSLRQQWVVPRLLRRLGADVYHSPYFLMPYRAGVPTLVTIHDLIPLIYPAYFTAGQRIFFSLALRLAIRFSRRTIAVSRATAADLQTHVRLRAERIVTIPEAADPAFYPRDAEAVASLRARLGLPARYVLYLGSNKPHKNLVRLIQAWAQLSRPADCHLVVAGYEDPRYPQARERAAALQLDSVAFLGPVAEGDLPALYSGAELFVFPSLYEGFGLPVIEAMACGTPVACSNVSSLPEVAGDAALQFDPHTPESIALTLGQALHDAELRDRLRRRSLAQALRFSWEHAAHRTLVAYRQEIGL